MQMDSETMRDLVMYWQGVTIDDEAAARLAALSTSVGKTLNAVAGRSMFDTEPAHFDRALVTMAGHGDD
jgi:hypothetical protein